MLDIFCGVKEETIYLGGFAKRYIMLANIEELNIQNHTGIDHGCTMDIAISRRSSRINIVAQSSDSYLFLKL